MRFLAATALAVLLIAPSSAQSLDLIGVVELPTIPRPGAESLDRRRSVGIPDVVGGSDVWAYTANDGSEYAIMGNVEGIAIVAVPSLEVVAQIAGPTNDAPFYWRDIKTYGSFAYISTEAYGPSEGLQIIDLRGLPHHAEEIAVIRGEGDRLVSSHNLSIDLVTGHAYMMNSDGNEIICLDLSNPIAPVEVAAVPVPDSHDIYARGDTLYVAEGRNPTFSVWDMSDKSNPTRMAQVSVPSPGYVHNIWPTDDGMYALTTEETVDKTVKVWDLSDLDNPTLVGRLARHEPHRAQRPDHGPPRARLALRIRRLHPRHLRHREPRRGRQLRHAPRNRRRGVLRQLGRLDAEPERVPLRVSDLEGTLTVLKWNPDTVDM